MAATSPQQVSISGLKPLTKYNFRIYAINGLGRSEAGETKITTDDEGKPGEEAEFS